MQCTAETRGSFFQRHLAADLGDGLAYREAFTTDAAQAVVAHLVNDRGLELVPKVEGGSVVTTEAERRSALHDAVPEPGKIVFVYRQAWDSVFGVGDSGKVRVVRYAPGGDPATMHKAAA